ncbi:beta-lactamase class A [Streptosporangium becharense]|uniref:Beta-lactamase class A n=1 Tax=Streptosporangium becharense TaxID=1816182 RepID=A0A7W9IMX0_9ACTN|nr:serine hydrolase [Streptosporangium becharense]MBB2910226.1 beta-lactamase class A [Streptosporangium becharense]MBB5822969.1 beta-lactamase class A [Streptosporangium becharense]
MGSITVAVSVPGMISRDEDAELVLASTGKLLLLASVARGIAAGELDPAEVVELRDDDRCGGSGLLGALSGLRWTIRDLAVLTASVSDNTATNALLRRIGLDRVAEDAAGLGLVRTRILDRIRDRRLPSHPPAFAVGTAGELARFAAGLDGRREWTRILLDWMARNTDRGLVPALLPHDPEEREAPRAAPEGRVWVAHKTGTDTGVRADVGVMIGPERRIGYAVLANGPAGSEHALVTAVRRAGLEIGRLTGLPPAALPSGGLPSAGLPQTGLPPAGGPGTR